jgi:hypothetical protein
MQKLLIYVVYRIGANIHRLTIAEFLMRKDTST